MLQVARMLEMVVLVVVVDLLELLLEREFLGKETTVEIQVEQLRPVAVVVLVLRDLVAVVLLVLVELELLG
jgi:hypothetical protein